LELLLPEPQWLAVLLLLPRPKSPTKTYLAAQKVHRLKHHRFPKARLKVL
jgi:hypothetical protein